ncbi:MAG: CPBP family intramembrane metalloprotease [Lachnospiraceae bacterium]|nr:CPBP family intramembrane metalloprotease [Lachnospiraceae bacterium]
MKTGKMIISIILSILTLVASQVLAQLLGSILVLLKIPSFIANIVAGISYVALTYLFLKLLCKKYLKADMREYKIPGIKIELKWGIIAFLLPLLVTAFYLLFVPGSFRQNPLNMNAKLDLISAGIFFSGLGAGIVEEMVFRGIMMSAIEKRFNRKVAIIVPSVLFGLVHILGMGFNLLSCVLVLVAGTMVGIMFSLIASETGSIWNSAIVHAIWNMIIIGGFLWVGAKFDKYSLFSYVLDTKSFLLTGGEFGIESSIVAVIGYSLVCLFVVLSKKKKQ